MNRQLAPTRHYVAVQDAGALIDHVVIGVRDLDEAEARFEDRYGLTAIQGGRHPGWGTANRLVPLGSTYLELVTVVDTGEASGSEFGRWVLEMVNGRQAAGWAVRTDDLDGTATRLGLDIVEGSRQARDGQTLHWRLAGVAQAARDPALPFFIQWGAHTPLPGRAEVAHRAGAVALAGLRIEGDETRLHEWLGTSSIPLEVTPGPRGLTGFSLETSTATIEVEVGE